MICGRGRSGDVRSEVEEVEPDLIEVFRTMSDDEANPAEPIKLLVVNEATMPSDTVAAFGFGPAKDFRF